MYIQEDHVELQNWNTEEDNSLTHQHLQLTLKD